MADLLKQARVQAVHFGAQFFVAFLVFCALAALLGAASGGRKACQLLAQRFKLSQQRRDCLAGLCPFALKRLEDYGPYDVHDVVMAGVMRAKRARERLPFDVQHRKVLFYGDETRTDLDELRKQLAEALKIALERAQEAATRKAMATAGPQGELKVHELVALQVIAAASTVEGYSVAVHEVEREINRAGFTSVAASLAIRKLLKIGFVSTTDRHDINGNEWKELVLAANGEDWLLDNQDKLQLHQEDSSSSSPDDYTTEYIASPPDDDPPFF